MRAERPHTCRFFDLAQAHGRPRSGHFTSGQEDPIKRGRYEYATSVLATVASYRSRLADPTAGVCPADPHLDEADPHAVAVGYVEDAARADDKKYPKFRPGQLCATCDLYLAKPTQPWAPCTLFPRRVVAGKGWCDAFRTRTA